MSTIRTQSSSQPGRAGTRFGYIVAIAVNVVGLVIVNNILEWGWLPFLTDDFSRVVPWMNVAFSVAVVVNVVYLFWDSRVFRSTTQIGLNIITFAVTYQVLRVFPFDFSAYAFNWGIVARILLILAMVGAAIGVITETYKLGSGGSANDKEVTNVDGA